MLGEAFLDLEEDEFENFEDFKNQVSINRESVEETDAHALSVLLELGFNGWIYFQENKYGVGNKGTQGLAQEMNIADAEKYVKYLFSYPISFGELKETMRDQHRQYSDSFIDSLF